MEWKSVGTETNMGEDESIFYGARLEDVQYHIFREIG
jgi:hypothetical protein